MCVDYFKIYHSLYEVTEEDHEEAQPELQENGCPLEP
jgi:hypothetical protein